MKLLITIGLICSLFITSCIFNSNSDPKTSTDTTGSSGKIPPTKPDNTPPPISVDTLKTKGTPATPGNGSTGLKDTRRLPKTDSTVVN